MGFHMPALGSYLLTHSIYRCHRNRARQFGLLCLMDAISRLRAQNLLLLVLSIVLANVDFGRIWPAIELSCFHSPFCEEMEFGLIKLKKLDKATISLN